LNGYI